ncbi:MAG TPA: GAP family protein [Candidatus Nanoarchaeia archaeon]|nr:GAP family protein [Candidatus Nanoarchaeia archaeon]
MRYKIISIFVLFFMLFGILIFGQSLLFNKESSLITGAVVKEGVSLPALPVVITTALIDSINPCAIGVLILLISTLLALSKDKKKMLFIGMIYILAVYITYFLAGVGLLLFIQRFNLAEPIGIGVGILVILLGLVEVKDFWWYGKGFSLSIPYKRSLQIKEKVKKLSAPGAIILGIFVAAVELPCTGGPYLAITTLLSRIGFDLTVLGYLLLYNFIFVLPLIIILLLAYFGSSMKKLEDIRKKDRRWMRLATGLVMIALGVLLILFSIGIINFGVNF